MRPHVKITEVPKTTNRFLVSLYNPFLPVLSNPPSHNFSKPFPESQNFSNMLMFPRKIQSTGNKFRARVFANFKESMNISTPQ